MLRNYLKITWKVLQRQPFYTFITLFGITLTLTILMVVIALGDHLLGDHYPDRNRSRSLYVETVRMEDSAQTYSIISNPSYRFFEKWVEPLKSPQAVAIHGQGQANTFSRDQRIKLTIRYANAAFWQVMAFDFLEGRPFRQPEIDNQARVAVITSQLRREFFGSDAAVVGQYIPIENEQYRIIGVVKGAPFTQIKASGDIYIPYNVPRSNYRSASMIGGFNAILLGENPAQLSVMAAEFERKLRQFPRPHLEDGQKYSVFEVKALPYLTNFLDNSPLQSIKEPSVFFLILGLLALMFMALPALNLVNLNLGRTLDRASEISIRKAFGAPTGALVVQFVVEHLVVALIGGVMALGLTAMILTIINRSQWIPQIELRVNLTIFGYGLLATVVFGLLAGVYPAYRMAKFNIIQGLKNQR